MADIRSFPNVLILQLAKPKMCHGTAEKLHLVYLLFYLQIYANLAGTSYVCNFRSKENVHFVVFWNALFALLSSTSTWHAEAVSVSGTDVSPSHFSEPPCQ